MLRRRKVLCSIECRGRDKIRPKHYSILTEKAYADWVGAMRAFLACAIRIGGARRRSGIF